MSSSDVFRQKPDMIQLTDLPDELLLTILSHCFDFNEQSDQTGVSTVAPPHLSAILRDYAINRRLHSLAHQAFFETYTHHVHVAPNHNVWDEGTLLHDLYSPTFSCEGHMRDWWDLVAEVRKMSIHIRIDDVGQINTAVHEAVKEVKRYPKLRKVWVTSNDDVAVASYARRSLQRSDGEDKQDAAVLVNALDLADCLARVHLGHH